MSERHRFSDQPEKDAEAIREEAEQRWKAGDIPVEEYVGWKDAAAWLDGSEEEE